MICFVHQLFIFQVEAQIHKHGLNKAQAKELRANLLQSSLQAMGML